MFNLAISRFFLIDSLGALLCSGAYIGCGWLFRRQLEDVVAALSKFGATIGIALGAGVVAYLILKFVRLWPPHRAYRAHRMTPGELKPRMEAGEPLVVVDLQSDTERQEGSIPGSVLVAYQGLDSLVPLSAQKMWCSTAPCPDELVSVRAALASSVTNVPRLHALQGGFSGWRALGFPVETRLSRVAGD